MHYATQLARPVKKSSGKKEGPKNRIKTGSNTTYAMEGLIL